jgi:hypothetical protein
MGVKLRPLRRTRRTESKSLDDEVMVVLLRALFVGPVVGPHVGGDHELIAFAGILRESFAQRSERHEPQARDYFARLALLVSARIVIADQAEAGIQSVAFGDELGVPGKIADRGQRETVHDDPP